MRFNQKKEDKQVRFDRVLYHRTSGVEWNPTDIRLIGTEPLPGLNEIWPSDHFGLFTTLKKL